MSRFSGQRAKLVYGVALGLLLVLLTLSPGQAQSPWEKLLTPPTSTAPDSESAPSEADIEAGADIEASRETASGNAATSPTSSLSNAPTQDDSTIERATVTLDGRKLFTVTAQDSQTAQSRAEKITQQLQSYVSQTPLPKVTVQQTEKRVSILVDEALLVRITTADGQLDDSGAVIPPSQLARIWAKDIRQALEQAQQQRTPESRRKSFIIAGTVLALAALMYWWTRRFQKQIATHLIEQIRDLLSGNADDSSVPQLLNLLAGIGLILARMALVVAAIAYAISLFPTVSGPVYMIGRRVLDSFVSRIFPLGNKTYSAVDLLILAVALVGVVIGARLLSNLLRSRVLSIAGLSSGSQAAIATLSSYTLIALGSIVLLQVWGLDLSSLTLLASALSFGIGFGLQNIARDFGSGLILLFERPIQVGDFLEVGDFVGTVNQIGARSTHIKTLDQISVIVPNSYFLENQVINWSHENPLSRIAIPVGVSYNADPNMVREVLLEAGRDQSRVVKMPPPQVFFKGFGDSALDFELLVWIVEPNRHPTIKSDLYFTIFALLAQKGIEIPFPQQDLHIRSGSLPVNLGSPDGMRQSYPSTEKIDPVN
ncbi:MAG: mechanosensitive ion channel domain-containing protein [Elainellaceae cyanobacterium]